MSKLRILFVASEISPFLETTKVADYVRQLPEAMQEKGMEIRILVPKFGCINERKSRLHEVVRLSGINITVGDEEKPLIIKVASIPTARLQVYFIDNDDYFNRKYALHDKEGNFYSDNDDRSIFFCKGVLETIKKLGWAPDVIHCHDWMTALVPLYLKTQYKKEPIFKNAKTVFSVFNNEFTHKFEKSFHNKIKGTEISDEMVEPLKSGEYAGLVAIGMKYADHVFRGQESYDVLHESLFDEHSKIKSVEFASSENNADFFFNFYNELSGVNELVES